MNVFNMMLCILVRYLIAIQEGKGRTKHGSIAVGTDDDDVSGNNLSTVVDAFTQVQIMFPLPVVNTREQVFYIQCV